MIYIMMNMHAPIVDIVIMTNHIMKNMHTHVMDITIILEQIALINLQYLINWQINIIF